MNASHEFSTNIVLPSLYKNLHRGKTRYTQVSTSMYMSHFSFAFAKGFHINLAAKYWPRLQNQLPPGFHARDSFWTTLTTNNMKLLIYVHHANTTGHNFLACLSIGVSCENASLLFTFTISNTRSPKQEWRMADMRGAVPEQTIAVNSGTYKCFGLQLGLTTYFPFPRSDA